ncbi:MAG TPA: HYR domain-containing protein, partial [Thermomicrobiales bacterium]|nr:HYR domain-containing protein [Thermomicrobiales bacterium]
REAGTTERVSVASDGTQANSGSGVFTLALSTDGRFVAFVSDATNLVPNDTNGRGDVFVRDRQAGATERVSVDSDGVQANGASDIHSVALSADGRYVAFLSAATNLVPGDTNSTTDVFVRDRQFGTTERVSVAGGGAQANNGSTDTPALSADGRYVAFASAATNLVPGVDTICEDVFVHDRQTGATERVSVASDGGQANGCSRDPTLSADGRSVAFRSFASNLVPDDTNGTWDVFVHDRLALDTTPPVLTMPAAITAEATGPAGAAVPYTATATDAVDGAVAVACAPASGATFPLGTTTVNCSAGDKAGNTATGSFAVTVRDTTRPTLTVPANMTLDATGPAGAPVTYTATASDTVDPRPAVSCAPPNGGTFAIGATTVVCTATDAAGNRARATFTVTVLGAADQTNNLVALVQTFDLKQGIATSLDAKLDAARSALAAAQAGDRPTACNQLGAFINEVQAQSGQGLTVDQANQLIAAARRTQAVLGCG